MTTLTMCDCGRVQEYDEALSLTCQHCDETLVLNTDDADENELLD